MRIKLACLLATLGMALTTPSALGQGRVFLTGHDPDFHAQSSTGARNLLNAGLSYVTNGTHNLNDGNKFLWVESRISPPGGHLIGENGLTAVGLIRGVHYERANAAELPTVDFANFTAIAIASSFGGLLTRAELDALIARSGDIESFINGGGGLLALSECLPCGANLLSGATPPDLYGFLPVSVSSIPPSPPFSITGFGSSAPFNLSNGDINDPTHNSFGLIGGLNPIDLDQSSQATTLAGVVFVSSILSQISLTPGSGTSPLGSSHGLTANIFESLLGDPIAGVTVTFLVVSGPNIGDTGQGVTDSNGDAFFNYLGDGGAGTDVIEATFVNSGGMTQTSNSAMCIWEAPECFMVMGSGRGLSAWSNIPGSHTFTPQIRGVYSSWPVSLDDLPEFVICDRRLSMSPINSGFSVLPSRKPIGRKYQVFAVQVMMWNPGTFPNNPEQFSGGLLVGVTPNGVVRTGHYGSSDGGLTIRAETYWNADGQKMLRFPFTIPGF